MKQLKINENLLMKIGSYIYPNIKGKYKIKIKLENRLLRTAKIKGDFSGFCFERYHFVVVDDEIVEFFIVKETGESKYSLMYNAMPKEKDCEKEYSLKIEESNKNIWTTKHTKEINYRVNKDSLVIYKKDIKPDCYIWTDGSFIGKIGKNKGYSSYIISDLDNNILHQEAIKMEKALNANDTEVFALVLALNKIQEIGLMGPTIITDSHYAFVKIEDRNSEIRTNIDKIYGKENVELMLTNFKNKKRKNNKAHNLLENKSLIKRTVSINEMISMGYVLKETPKEQEVKILKTVSIPRMVTKPENVIIPCLYQKV